MNREQWADPHSTSSGTCSGETGEYELEVDVDIGGLYEAVSRAHFYLGVILEFRLRA